MICSAVCQYSCDSAGGQVNSIPIPLFCIAFNNTDYIRATNQRCSTIQEYCIYVKSILFKCNVVSLQIQMNHHE